MLPSVDTATEGWLVLVGMNQAQGGAPVMRAGINPINTH